MLKVCIPACQELVKERDTAFRAVAKLAIGPGEATLKGKVTLSDIDARNGYTITSEGEGGIAGFTKDGAKVHLSDAEGRGTTLAYDVRANVGGKIAQLGGGRSTASPRRCLTPSSPIFAKAASPSGSFGLVGPWAALARRQRPQTARGALGASAFLEYVGCEPRSGMSLIGNALRNRRARRRSRSASRR